MLFLRKGALCLCLLRVLYIHRRAGVMTKSVKFSFFPKNHFLGLVWSFLELILLFSSQIIISFNLGTKANWIKVEANG